MLPTLKLPAMRATETDRLVCPATLEAGHWNITTRVAVIALTMYITANNPARLCDGKKDMSEPPMMPGMQTTAIQAHRLEVYIMP